MDLQTPSRELLLVYHTWLQMELRYLTAELWPDPEECRQMLNFIHGNKALAWHIGEAPASTRAEAVLGLIGCEVA